MARARRRGALNTRPRSEGTYCFHCHSFLQFAATPLVERHGVTAVQDINSEMQQFSALDATKRVCQDNNGDKRRDGGAAVNGANCAACGSIGPQELLESKAPRFFTAISSLRRERQIASDPIRRFGHCYFRSTR